MERRTGLLLGLGLCLLMPVAVWIADLAQMLGGSQQPLVITGRGALNDTLIAARRARSRMAGQYERAGRFYEEAMGHYRVLTTLTEKVEREQECSGPTSPLMAGERAHASANFANNGTVEDAHEAESDVVQVGQLALQAVDNAHEASHVAFEEIVKELDLIDIGCTLIDTQEKELDMNPLFAQDRQRWGALLAANKALRAELGLIRSMFPALQEQAMQIIHLQRDIEVNLIHHGHGFLVIKE